jgi:hypothetical protein
MTPAKGAKVIDTSSMDADKLIRLVLDIIEGKKEKL